MRADSYFISVFGLIFALTKGSNNIKKIEAL